MSTNVNTMKMPANYVDMNADEIEYCGGWFGVVFSLAGLAISCVAVATKNKALGYIGNGFTAFGAITSLGTGTLACAFGKEVVRRGLKMTIADSADAAGKYLAGAGLDAGSTIVGIATWQK